MSADFETKNFKGYAHRNYVHVIWKPVPDTIWGWTDETPVGDFTPETVAQLQSIIDQWKSGHARR